MGFRDRLSDKRAERRLHNDRDSSCTYWWGDRPGSSVGVTNERCLVCRPEALSASAPAEQLAKRAREPQSEYDYQPQPVCDPETGSPVPCVWCSMSPQVEGYRGCCSQECLDGMTARTGVSTPARFFDGSMYGQHVDTNVSKPALERARERVEIVQDRIAVPVEAIEKIREAVAPWADFEGKPPYWVRVLTELLEGIDNA